MLVALLGLMLLANIGFTESDTGAISISVITPTLTVSIGDVAFGIIPIDSGYTKAVGALTFSSNVNWILRMQSSTRGIQHSNGTDRLILKCYYAIDGTPSPDPTGANWGTDWIEVWWVDATPDEWLQLDTGAPVDKTVAPLPTLDFATQVTATTPDGDYATVVTLEILMV